jgi:hypothetical protein
MKFMPHFEAKLEYLVRKLDLQPAGTRTASAGSAEAAADTNVRRLSDFRSSSQTPPRRAARSAR